MSTSAKDNKQTEGKDASSQGGRIVHDSRGNAVWKWDKDGGDPASTASTSKMLRTLDLANLRVEDAAPTGAPTATSETNAADEGKKRGSGYGPGYNPYDRTAPVRRTPPRK